MRRPVPTLARCEATILRESRYWIRNFHGLIGVDDLRQEGRIVALRVLNHFDPMRGTQVETLLTDALRRHYRRLIKRTLVRAFLYDGSQRARFVADLRERERMHPFGLVTARVLLSRVRELPLSEQRLAVALVQSDGRVASVARRYHWTRYYTHKRVSALRALLGGKGGERVSPS
jgi:hypothetical protein